MPKIDWMKILTLVAAIIAAILAEVDHLQLDRLLVGK